MNYSFCRTGLLALLTVVAFTACQKTERELNLDFNPVTQLNTPTNNATVQLQPTSTPTPTITFTWEATKATDGGLLLYEIAFDKESGDFTNPVYRKLSDGSGTQTRVTIDHKEMVKISNAGGIAASTTGKLKWTVIASKSLNRKTASTFRTLEVTRPAGFAEIPENLYLTGTATEGSAGTGVRLKKTEAGVFEVYTSLKAGSYQLSDKADGSGKNFYVEGAVIKEGANTTTVTGATKVYRLRYDFNVASVLEATEIQGIGLYMSAYNTEIGQLTYAGNGTWQAASIPVAFYPFSWGRDERYKFAMQTLTGKQYLGSTNANNVSPVGQPSSYFYLVPVSNSQWDNTYKFNPSADNKNVKVTLNFSTNGSYTHEVITL